MNTYETHDIHLAAYLKVKGLELRSYHTENFKATFVFDDTADLRALVKSYFSGRGEVPALAYKNAVADLKTMVMNT